jgi:hypothetical protein
MGGKMDDSVIGKRSPLDVGLAGVGAEMNIGCGSAEIPGDRVA